MDQSLELRTDLVAGETRADAHRHDRHAVAPLFVRQSEGLDAVPYGFRQIRRLLPRLQPCQHDEFLAAITADRPIVGRDRLLQRIGNENEAAIAFLMAVKVVVPLEEIDVDKDCRKALPASLPVAPIVPELLIDRAAVVEARERIGMRQPQQRFSAVRGFLLLDLRLEGIEKDLVALPVEFPVHIGREDEARDVEGSEGDLIGYAFRYIEYQGKKERGEDDSRGYDRQAKVETEE